MYLLFAIDFVLSWVSTFFPPWIGCFHYFRFIVFLFVYPALFCASTILWKPSRTSFSTRGDPWTQLNVIRLILAQPFIEKLYTLSFKLAAGIQHSHYVSVPGMLSSLRSSHQCTWLRHLSCSVLFLGTLVLNGFWRILLTRTFHIHIVRVAFQSVHGAEDETCGSEQRSSTVLGIWYTELNFGRCVKALKTIIFNTSL